MIFSWLASLGLASKLTIGAGAVAVGVAGGGVAGVLPPVAQKAFDEVIAVPADETDEADVGEPIAEEPPADLTPDDGEGDADGGAVDTDEDGSEEETEDDGVEAPAEEEQETLTHGDKVSAVARDKTLHGREHGKAVSAAAQDKSGEQAPVGDDATDGDSDDDEADEPAEDEDEASDVEAVNKGKGKDKRSH